MRDERRRRCRRLAAAVLALTILPAPVSAMGGCGEAGDPDYGTYRCKVARLRGRSHVVVAVVDTGINPYHVDFGLAPGDDRMGVPPWEYVDGYPRSASALNLSLGQAYYGWAMDRDEGVWSSVQRNVLYHVPGTKIVGAISFTDATNPGRVPILDESGHGTATASVAAGRVHGSASDPDVVLVVVEGIGAEPFRWAASQPWIDVVTNSWGYAANTYWATGEHRVTKAAAEAGRLIVFAAGNGVTNSSFVCDPFLTTTSSTTAPPWVLSVGAVSPGNRQAYCWHSIPPDVSSFGSDWPAAHHQSIEGERDFGGTSNAAPLVAGVVANQVLAARRAFGDAVEGAHGHAALAVAGQPGPHPLGLLADGVLDAGEVRELVEKTALPEEWREDGCRADLYQCATTTPTTPAYWLYQGYGIVDAASSARALDVLFGRAPMPDRSDVDRWMAVKHAVHGAIWSAVP